MNELYCLIPVWNADDYLEECVEKLIPICDKIIILEGKWKFYNGDLRSSDQTIDIMMEFKQKYMYKIELMFLEKSINQYEARNLMISKVPDNSYFINIDADEILVYYHKDFKRLLSLPLKGFRIRSYEPPQTIDKSMPLDSPRIIYLNNGLRMTPNHRYYDFKDGTPLIYDYQDFPLIGLIIEHRTKKTIRIQAEEYKKQLCKWEFKH
jgi:glycosyltransferase involved in cell wall biosynthesis